ncbi:MAG: uracil-DNA glycosylase, partial [Acidimicrobiales bacterium]
MGHWPNLSSAPVDGPPSELDRLEREITACRACPRLVAWREQVAVERRAAFRDEDYWARPVPGFGDPAARVAIVGLAPAAHGANRTGRMFTGDRSGDFLYAALWRTGFANQPMSVSRGDGLRLDGAWITAPVRCAPPANKPTPAERDRCLPYLERELALLPELRVFVPLGQFGYQALAGS